MAKPRSYPCAALDPSGQSGENTVEFQIEAAIIETLQRYGPAHKLWRMINAREVLQKPDAIFRGWNRHGQENALVYVGRPQDRRDERITTPPLQG